ncbi:MAG: hypothetical protein ACRDSH_03615 [Pseudonocardiaceae bacterium]
MSDELTFTEVEEQRAELLPARTVLSLFSAAPGTGCNGTNNTVGGTQECFGGFNFFNYNFGGHQTNSAGTGTPGRSG